MFHRNDPAARPSVRAAAIALAAITGLAAAIAPIGPAAANTAAAPPVGTADSTLINLIRLLVAEGVITPEKAEQLLRTARSETAAAAPPAVAAVPGAGDSVRVPYIPEPVRRQIREEVKQEVLKQAQAESWAAPNAVPDWVSRFGLEGDLRVRYERDQFPGGNGPLTNFNAINTGQPFNTTPTVTDPQPPAFNTDEDRDRFLLRARLGVNAKVNEQVSAHVRVASGNDSGPVSTNQTLGTAPARGSGGNFSKYNIWLDQAYLRFEPIDEVTVDVGRFPNPFFHTDLIWDGDLNFDGLSATGTYEAAKDFHPFATLGGFPVYNTDFNFSTNDIEKEGSRDRYLLGGQIGFDSRPVEELGVKLGVAYYHFIDMEGQSSDPCTVNDANSQCNTDISRPQFAQKGNTYFRLRNIIPDTNNNFGDNNQFQYFGLATEFHQLALTGRADLNTYAPIHVILDGEFVQNLALDNSDMRRRGEDPTNFLENNTDEDRDYEGGGLGFLVRGTVGYPVIAELWDWNVSLGYKYLESDAVVDGLTDSDFALGGTNAKGFILGGNVGLGHNVWLAARWLSSEEITGPAYSVDVFQADINARF